MSNSSAPRKGFGSFLKRIFGADDSTPENLEVESEPLPPPPQIPETPVFLVPRKGVGTVLRQAVHPEEGAAAAPPESFGAAKTAATAITSRSPKPPSRLLSLPRTVLSMLRKAPPARPAPEASPAPAHDPMEPEPLSQGASTRRKDYPIV